MRFADHFPFRRRHVRDVVVASGVVALYLSHDYSSMKSCSFKSFMHVCELVARDHFFASENTFGLIEN